MITCKLCGKEFKAITHKHIKKDHPAITLNEYRKKFGKITSLESRKKMSIHQKGKKMGLKNPAKRKEVRQKISNTVKQQWDNGAYQNRVNGMLGVFGNKSYNWKPEIHTPLYLAEHDYVNFLSNFQDIKTCNRCGSKNKKINIHHIDENHKNFLPSNLEPLCIPCHASYHYNKQKRCFITIGKMFKIDAAHFLPLYNGPCHRLHGHQWKIEVRVRKRIDAKTGMVMDFNDLKKIVNEHIINVLDHTCINDLFYNPTAENMLVWFWEKLMFDGKLKGLYEISLWETDDSKATIDVESLLSILSTNIEEYLIGERTNTIPDEEGNFL